MAQSSNSTVTDQNRLEEKIFAYKAFLSYSHKDELQAERLHRKLERYRIPKDLRRNGPRLGAIFRDKDELSVAPELDASIKRALKASESLIVLCSPHAVRSQWVDMEIAYFKSLGREDRIFAVLLSGVPNAENRGFPGNDECLPQSLRYDFTDAVEVATERAEPLATDLRPGGDGQKLGLLKLVSGLLDVGLDKLLKRQLVHARRRLMGVVAASSLLIAVFAGLSWATHSAQMRAEARQADAENFVEYLLSDLSLQLETYGRLDLLDSVGIKAIDYYAQFDEDELDAKASGRRARTFHFMGDLQNALAKTDESQAYFDQAYHLTETGLSEAPDDPDRLFEHARSAYFKSLPLRRKLNYPAELIMLEEFSDLSQRLSELENGSTRSIAQLALVDMNIGRVKLRTNEFDAAIDRLNKADARFQALMEKEPTVENLLHRTENLAWLSEYHRSQNDYQRSYDIRMRQNEMIDNQLTLNPDDFRLIEASVYAKIGLAGSANALDLNEVAKGYFNQALKGTEDALRLEPRREKMRRAQSVIFYSVMKTSILEGDETAYRTAEIKLTKLAAETLRTSTDENKYWDEILPGLLNELKSDFD